MNWVSLMLFILESQDVSVTLQHIKHVLLKQAHQSELKLLVAADSVRIVLDSAVKLSLLNIHSFHTVAGLFLS